MTVSTGVEALCRASDRWNEGNLDGYLQLYADDAVLHGYVGVDPGIASIRAFYRSFWTAFPSCKLSLDDVFASDDKVTCRFSLSGTHIGPFNGIPATGRSFVLPGITVLRFNGDRCVERWSQADFLSLLQQLGALPG